MTALKKKPKPFKTKQKPTLEWSQEKNNCVI